MRQRYILFLIMAVLWGFVGCAPNDSEKGSQEEDQAPAQTTEEATQENTREVTQEATPAEQTAAPTETAASSVDEDEDADGYDATVTVTNVVDGDTVDISPGVDGIERVRLIGVDAPETRDPDCGVQPYGDVATAFTTSELQGQEVGLEFDVERTDRYDRLLAYAYPSDEEMFNETLLEEGYAQVATFPPNIHYVERFETAQERARAAGLGIWGLPPDQLAQLEDRGNGIGGEGCIPPVQPTPPPPPTPAPQPDPNVPDVPPAPAPPSVQGGVDCSSGARNVPVVPGSKGDGDDDGIACEKR